MIQRQGTSATVAMLLIAGIILSFASAGAQTAEGTNKIDFRPYRTDLQKRIKRAWFPPQHHESERVQVAFKVHKDGQMTDLHIRSTSALDISNQAAKKAVENGSPFRPLPAGAPDEVDVDCTFDYNKFNGGVQAVIKGFEQ